MAFVPYRPDGTQFTETVTRKRLDAIEAYLAQPAHLTAAAQVEQPKDRAWEVAGFVAAEIGQAFPQLVLSCDENEDVFAYLNRLFLAVTITPNRSVPPEQPAAGDFAREWQPIETAPKNRTPLLCALHPALYPDLEPHRSDLARWNGLQIVMQHPGVESDGFDIGWNVAAPVGNGGFPDRWIVGWQPLPKAPEQPA